MKLRSWFAIFAVFASGFAGWAIAQSATDPAISDVPPAQKQFGESDPTDEALPDAEIEEEARAPRNWQEKRVAELRGLDKITGRSTDFKLKADEPVVFGSLEVTLSSCFQTPPEEPPESAAFLKVRSLRPMTGVDDDAEDLMPEIFSGWMFSSSPGLNALEHPVYDVWVIECEPVKTVAAPVQTLVEPVTDDDDIIEDFPPPAGPDDLQ